MTYALCVLLGASIAAYIVSPENRTVGSGIGVLVAVIGMLISQANGL